MTRGSYPSYVGVSHKEMWAVHYLCQFAGKKLQETPQYQIWPVANKDFNYVRTYDYSIGS